MVKAKTRVVALTIAGSDSGGGAGIQADLKTFAALGVHGTSVITCLTAQNPRQVLAVETCSPTLLRRQLEAVYTELPPAAAKTGMLFSVENIRIVARFLRAHHENRPLVVDPVMLSTSGTRLLTPDAIRAMQNQLLPLATLITPNVDEAIFLAEMKIRTLPDMQAAARKLQGKFGAAILLKGGHLRSSGRAVDVFFDGQKEQLLSAAFIPGISTHGTGCTCSAAICAALALGQNARQAVKTGKRVITQAIKGSYRCNGHWCLAVPTK